MSDFEKCPYKKILENEVYTLREISEARDNEQESARQSLIMRFDKFEVESNKKFDNLQSDIKRLETKIDDFEKNLPKKLSEIINVSIGRVVKWFVVVVIGTGIVFYFRPLIVTAFQVFFGG